ncbi:hypothetical protein [Aestuariimicrobium sp. Y1814]|uniref:hypothetical protein n=1 Tax=Aestuariimicrobium sp. Y1814 TaxID=3418742 RepID=UPI003DA774F8
MDTSTEPAARPASSPKKRSAWPILLLALVMLAVGAGVMTAVNRAMAPLATPITVETEKNDTRIIESITRKEQVVLLSLGIQGIAEQTQTTKLFGKSIPGSSRAMFVQYNFHAKLGIEGKDVEIQQTGDDEYLVTIPEFIFIGHDKESFKLVTEDKGVLGFVTPEIDPVEMINGILNDDAKQQYVNTNREVLRDQAQAFYSGIILSIDPAVKVKFAFEGN